MVNKMAWNESMGSGEIYSFNSVLILVRFPKLNKCRLMCASFAVKYIVDCFDVIRLKLELS